MFIVHVVPAFAEISAPSRQVLEVASQLGTEGEGARVRKELEALPRAKVITAVREGLTEGEPYAGVAARAANALHLTEVEPDLEKAFAKNSDWNFALALASVASESKRSHLANEWQSKLTSFESPTRIAVLQTLAQWHQPLQDAMFDRMLNDASFQVRIAAVRNFAMTKDKLQTPEQISRYKKAFAMKPYKVRLAAMADFNSLSKSERARLANAIDDSFKASCKAETKTDVKTECEKMMKGAKK
jgi:hypothetical protein